MIASILRVAYIKTPQFTVTGEILTRQKMRKIDLMQV